MLWKNQTQKGKGRIVGGSPYLPTWAVEQPPLLHDNEEEREQKATGTRGPERYPPEAMATGGVRSVYRQTKMDARGKSQRSSAAWQPQTQGQRRGEREMRHTLTKEKTKEGKISPEKLLEERPVPTKGGGLLWSVFLFFCVVGGGTRKHGSERERNCHTAQPEFAACSVVHVHMCISTVRPCTTTDVNVCTRARGRPVREKLHEFDPRLLFCSFDGGPFRGARRCDLR